MQVIDLTHAGERRGESPDPGGLRTPFTWENGGPGYFGGPGVVQKSPLRRGEYRIDLPK